MSDIEYTYSNINENTFSITRDSIEKSMRELEWLKYEVNPEWSRFCSFGPEDIGSVWEKIGAIQKRPRWETVLMNDAALAALRKASDKIEHEVLYGSAKEDMRLFGLQVFGCHRWWQPTWHI